MRRERNFYLSKKQKRNEMIVGQIGMYSLIIAVLIICWIMIL